MEECAGTSQPCSSTSQSSGSTRDPQAEPQQMMVAAFFSFSACSDSHQHFQISVQLRVSLPQHKPHCNALPETKCY